MPFLSNAKIIHVLAAPLALAFITQPLISASAPKGDPFPQHALGITTNFGKWPANVIPFQYNPTGAPAEYSDIAVVEAVFEDAIADWAGYCDVRFVYGGVDNAIDVDDSSDGIVVFAWEDIGGAAGRAGPASTDQLVSTFGHWLYVDGSLKLNPNVFTSAGSTPGEVIRNAISIRVTTAHELGHLIGLGHSDRPNSLMYANPYNSISHTLEDDIQACRAMYGYSSVYNPPPKYQPPAAGPDNYDILFLSASPSTFPNDIGSTDDGTIPGTDSLLVRYQNTAPGYADTLVHVIVDPLGHASVAASADIVTGTAGGYGVTTLARLREIPGLWTVYVYDSTGLQATLTLNVTTSLPVVNDAPEAEFTFTDNPATREMSLTTDVTGDTEGDSATIIWHIPYVGETAVPLGGPAGSDTQNTTIPDLFDWEVFAEVRDDAVRYDGSDPNSGPAGLGFQKLFRYYASGLNHGPDLTGDNSSDILWRNMLTGQNWVYGMKGNLPETSSGINTVTATNWEIVGQGDYDGDGKSDIFWRNNFTGQNWVYLMNGASIVSSAGVNTVSDTEWRVIGNGDYNGDGRSDVLWRHQATNQVAVYFMTGASYIAQVVDLWDGTRPDQTWQVVQNADFDFDGKTDLLWRNSNSGQNVIYFMDGAVITSKESIYTVSSPNWQVAGSGDYNGDGFADILWRNIVTGQNWVYLMVGSTVASSQGINTIDTNWDVAGNGDYNGDSFADILLRNKLTGQNWVYFMNGATIISSAGINTVSSLDWEIVDTN